MTTESKPPRTGLAANIVSGLATSLFNVPSGLAYAQLAGVNPVYGLYAGIVSTLVAALSTGTVLMISTITSAIALATGSVLQVAGIQSSQMPQALFTLTFLVGAIMFVLGLLRLGSIVNFVSNAVMTGFVAGTALLIILGQEQHVSGYAPVGADQFDKTINWLQNYSQWNLTTVAVSIAVIILMVIITRIHALQKFAAIIVLVTATIVVDVLKIPVALVGSIATIPSSLPAPMLPDFSLAPQLVLGAVSVMFVALAQGAAVHAAMPNPDGSKASQSRDFLGEGLGNLAGSFFQSIGTGGALSQSAVSVNAGATGRLGGVADAMMVSWPAGIKAKGELRDQYTHAIDVVPTIYDCLGIELPDVVKGYTQWALEGTSFKYSLDDAKAKTQKESQYYQMLGTRALWRDGWKVDAIHAGAPSNWGHFGSDKWALYHTEVDRSEMHDLGDQNPELRDELIALWHFQAGKFFGLPLDDRDAISILTTPRPQMSPPRDRYIYYPGTLEVAEAVAVNVRGRSFKIAAEVDLKPGAQGVMFSHGHLFGGHALYIKDGKLKYVYNFLGENEQMITSNVDVPTGKCVLGLDFVKEKYVAIRNSPVPNQCVGTATLYINDKPVGVLQGMTTQLGKFNLCGEGLNIGREGGMPVTLDYPGNRPWAFSGGVLKRVVVDVSGEEYHNFELEAAAMMSND